MNDCGCGVCVIVGNKLLCNSLHLLIENCLENFLKRKEKKKSE